MPGLHAIYNIKSKFRGSAVRRQNRRGGLSNTGRALESFVPHVSVALAAEESNTYPRVVARLNANWRVIACRDDLQWILQRRRGQKRGSPRWTGWRYFRTRQALLHDCYRYVGAIGGDALVIL